MNTFRSKHQPVHNLKQPIMGLFIIGLLLFLTACSKRNDTVLGTWIVVEGRNQGAIFDFSDDNRLYFYGGEMSAAWYGMQVESKKEKSLSSSNYRAKPTVLGIPAEQGEVDWKTSDEIKFWPESAVESKIVVLNGPIYLLKEASSDKLIIDELQYDVGTEEFKKVGEMMLIPHENIPNNDDSSLANSIVGKWEVKWEENDEIYLVTTFDSNGTYQEQVYKSEYKRELLASVKGKWWVNDKRLCCRVFEVTPKQKKIQTYASTDKIEKIDSTEITLVDHNGNKHTKHRIKNNS